MYSSFTLVADVPPGVVTVTSTVLPIELVMVGEVAVIVVAETTVTPVAAALPKWTAVAPVKLEPVIVTAVPPGVVVEAVLDVTEGPEAGVTAVTTGPAAAAPAGDAARNPRAGAMRTTAARAPTFARDFIVSFHQSFRILRSHTIAQWSTVAQWGTRILPEFRTRSWAALFRAFPQAAHPNLGETGDFVPVARRFPIPLSATGPEDKLPRMSPGAAIRMRRHPAP